MKKVLFPVLACIAVLIALTAFAAYEAYAVNVKGPVTFVAGSSVTIPTGVTLSTYSDVGVQNDPTGGNAGARTDITGRYKVTLVPFATMTNGAATAKTTSHMDDSATGEWAATANVTESDDATVYRVGSAGYKLAFASTAVATNGSVNTISALDMTTEESIGFWFRASRTIAAGDLEITLVDSTANHSFPLPAYATPNKWVWIEIDITVLATTDGDAVTGIGIDLTTAGATHLAAFNIWLDGMYSWDATEELALGQDIVEDGVMSVLTIVKANTGTHDMAALVENTGYFVAYRSGNDSLVTITDQSAKAGIAMVEYR
jgi:hypothetical protein